MDSSKRGRPKKRWKEAVEKDMLAKGLKRSNAQDCAVCRLGCKNQLTPARGENNPGYKTQSLLSAYLEQQMNDDDCSSILFCQKNVGSLWQCAQPRKINFEAATTLI